MALESPRFDPFRRTDSYGLIGKGPHTFPRRVGLVVRTVLLVPPRLIGCFGLSLTMRGICFISRAIPFTRSWIIGKGAMTVSRSILFLLGFVYIKHQRYLADPDKAQTSRPITDRNCIPIVVSNHISWLDILVLQFLYSAAYVTRAETRKTPIVGGVCDALPCIYVDREKSHDESSGACTRTTTDKVVDRVRFKWENPKAHVRPLAIFPEGTTTNGSYLLPFRTGAFVAGVPVQPVLINYPQRRNRPSLAWETVRAPTHIGLVMSTFINSAAVYELPMYYPSEQERENPKLYADNVRQYMLKWGAKLGLNLKESASKFEDKKEYHKLLREELGIPE